MVAAERVLRLDGASNFRDLGGYPAEHGRETRWGKVFRSDAPHRLTPADQIVVHGLGLRVVYDLRTDKERSHMPSVLPVELRQVLLSIGGDATRNNPLNELFDQGRLNEIPEDFLTQVYRDLAEDNAPTFGRLLTGLASDDLPALFHCTAGKDRTGMGAALLLSVLGVPEETVLDDYVMSRAFWSERRMSSLRPKLMELGMAEERYYAIFGAPREAMAAALGGLRERYGSIENYLTAQAGVTPGTLAALKSRLLS